MQQVNLQQVTRAASTVLYKSEDLVARPVPYALYIIMSTFWTIVLPSFDYLRLLFGCVIMKLC